MMSRHFRLSSELTGAIAKNQPSAPGSFFNQFVIYIYIQSSSFNSKDLLVRFLCCHMDRYTVDSAKQDHCLMGPTT